MARILKKQSSSGEAPSSAGTSLTREEVGELLASANLPIRAGKITRSLLDERGFADFKGYVGHTLMDDVAEGKGFNVYGKADLRSDALMLAAKLFALGSSSVYFVTLHQLIGIMEAGGDRLDILRRVRHLFIDWFEREFTKSIERPYSFYQLVSVEEFLLQRRQSMQVTFYGSRCAWDAHTWWSRDFLSAMQENVVDIKVGIK